MQTHLEVITRLIINYLGHLKVDVSQASKQQGKYTPPTIDIEVNIGVLIQTKTNQSTPLMLSTVSVYMNMQYSSKGRVGWENIIKIHLGEKKLSFLRLYIKFHLPNSGSLCSVNS